MGLIVSAVAVVEEAGVVPFYTLPHGPPLVTLPGVVAEAAGVTKAPPPPSATAAAAPGSIFGSSDSCLLLLFMHNQLPECVTVHDNLMEGGGAL